MGFSQDGKIGWAVGRGLALRLTGNQWIFDANSASRFTYPGAVLVSDNGDVWVTDVRQLHLLRGNHWESWRIPEPESTDPRQWPPPRHSLHSRLLKNPGK
jgi:hypothetical protein